MTISRAEAMKQADIVRGFIGQNAEGISLDRLVHLCKESNLTTGDVWRCLKVMDYAGEIYSPRKGAYALVDKDARVDRRGV